MAVVGYMGESSSQGIVFSVSDQVVLTLENFKWSGSARYSVHNRHNYHALTEYTGMDPDKITFDIQLLIEHGVNPLEQVVKLWKYEREGTAVALTIGSKCYGKYRLIMPVNKIDTISAAKAKFTATVIFLFLL